MTAVSGPDQPPAERPLILVIVGITGDLARHKLLPALATLYRRGDLPADTTIVGVSRRSVSFAELFPDDGGASDTAAQTAPPHVLAGITEFFCIADGTDDDYRRLLTRLLALSAERPGARRLYYLSIPSDSFCPTVHKLGQTGHSRTADNESHPPILLVEKPFGSDTASARQLIAVADESFGEAQTYRIDHYLAKETAQNILAFRFRNPVFQVAWHSRAIESIYVRSHQRPGIEGRAKFYESTGALRDILQSHLLQLLALVTMEQPAAFTSNDIHRSKLRLLQSIVPIAPDEVAQFARRGQYASYQQEVANPGSTVETFARLTLRIDNEQWRGTQVVLETGKAMPASYTDISVRFRPVSLHDSPNELVFRLQPHEGITLRLQAKQPGLTTPTTEVDMAFDYETTFGVFIPDAYERVIMDALRADQSLFATAEEIMTSWNIIENVLSAWQNTAEGLLLYPDGTIPADL